MHSQPMKDSEGDFSEWAVAADAACPDCHATEVEERAWDSHCGGYTDYEYRCRRCQKMWWVEGIDS